MSKDAQRPGWAIQAVLILAASLALGGIRQAAFPGAIPWVQDWSNFIESKAMKSGIALVTLDEVKAIVQRQSHILLDARPLADYDAGHLPGALALPQTAIDEHLPNVLPLLAPEQPILTYCSGKQCDESFLLTVDLRKQGFTNIVLYPGGFTEWQKAGLAVEGGTAGP
jgi:rhodanese-related sulfurtransferase